MKEEFLTIDKSFSTRLGLVWGFHSLTSRAPSRRRERRKWWSRRRRYLARRSPPRRRGCLPCPPPVGRRPPSCRCLARRSRSHRSCIFVLVDIQRGQSFSLSLSPRGKRRNGKRSPMCVLYVGGMSPSKPMPEANKRDFSLAHSVRRMIVIMGHYFLPPPFQVCLFLVLLSAERNPITAFGEKTQHLNTTIATDNRHQTKHVETLSRSRRIWRKALLA